MPEPRMDAPRPSPEHSSQTILPKNESRGSLKELGEKLRGKNARDDLQQVADQSEESTVDVKRFSKEARKKLEKQGFVVLELSGRTERQLRESYRDEFTKNQMNKDIIPAEIATEADVPSMRSEVAIDPKSGYIKDSERMGYSQQYDKVQELSRKLQAKIPGVRAIIGTSGDYVDTILTYKDQTGDFLLDLRKTTTRTHWSRNHKYLTTVGPYHKQFGLRTGVWSGSGPAGILSSEDPGILPLIVPV